MHSKGTFGSECKCLRASELAPAGINRNEMGHSEEPPPFRREITSRQRQKVEIDEEAGLTL